MILVGDSGGMCILGYENTIPVTMEESLTMCKEAGMDAIKLEGGVSCESRIKAIVDAGICVFGHIGMTPQSSGIQGVLAQGRDVPQAKGVIDDGYAVQRAGAHFMLVEPVPPELGQYLASQLDIPVYGIGGGWALDG